MGEVYENLKLNFYRANYSSVFHNTVVFWNSFKGPLNENILEFIRSKKIEIIEFGQNFNSSIDELENCESINLIRLHHIFQQQINKWPPKLVSLYMGMDYKFSIKYWPDTLRFLDLTNNFHLLLNLPPYIESLKLYNDTLNPYSSCINLSYLPINLLSLEIDCIGIEKLYDILNPNLKSIRIIKLFVNHKDEKIIREMIPNSLTDIQIYRYIVKHPKNLINE